MELCYIQYDNIVMNRWLKNWSQIWLYTQIVIVFIQIFAPNFHHHTMIKSLVMRSSSPDALAPLIIVTLRRSHVQGFLQFLFVFLFLFYFYFFNSWDDLCLSIDKCIILQNDKAKRHVLFYCLGAEAFPKLVSITRHKSFIIIDYWLQLK